MFRSLVLRSRMFYAVGLGACTGGPVDDGLSAEAPSLGGATSSETAPTQQVAYHPAGPYSGRFASGVGDVDGDGFDDVVVLAGSSSASAGLRLHRGSRHGVHQELDAILAVDGAVGHAKILGGDLDGDGRSEIVMSSDGAVHGHGRVDVWSIDSSGRTRRVGVPSLISAEMFGASLGFLESDLAGGARLAVGVPDANMGAGAIDIYEGAALESAPRVTVSGIGRGERLGEVMDGAGDVDGDGFADLVVRRAPTEPGRPARLVLLRGPDFAMPGAAWTLTGSAGDSDWAESVAGLGDVNGDGYDDVAFTTPTLTLTSDLEVRLGGPSGWQTERYRLAIGDWIAVPSDDRLGDTGDRRRVAARLAAVGDVTGDGLADLMVGFVRPTRHGHVLLWRGSEEGLAAQPHAVYQEASEASSFGLVVSTAGDVNGDGELDALAWSADPHEPARAGVLYVWQSPLAATPAQR